MASVQYLIEMLARIKDGEPCTTKEWDSKRVPMTVMKILKKHDLTKKYNAKVPVNQDLDLADAFWEAGLELAEVLGIHCTDTESVIHFSREELLNALKQAPSELHLGYGPDQVTMYARHPEDPTKPLYTAAPAIQIDEELYLDFVSELVRYKGIDCLIGPSIDTVFGIPALTGTPFETAAGILESQLRTQALWKAGRPGMPQMGMSSSCTEFGFMAGYAANNNPLNPQMCICLQPSELKTNYCNFNKMLTAAAFGSFSRPGCPTMIGGYSGSPEGAVIANIASDILQFALLSADMSATSVFDVRLNSCCCRTGLWVMSTSLQASTRNSHMILEKIINQSAGPCTEDILYTNAAGLVAGCVSGMANTTGPRSAGGSVKNYLTPLEAHFAADAFKAAASLKLDKAEELVEYCLTKYEDSVSNQPVGKSYYECYDRKTRKPIPKWTAIDKKVRTDLYQRGLDI